MKNLVTSFNENAIDRSRVSPINLFKVELTGLTLSLCDRGWGTGESYCRYDAQLYEPLVVSWEDNMGDINPSSLITSPGSMTIVLDNNMTVGGQDNIAKLATVYDFYYATVTHSLIFEEAQTPRLLAEDGGFILLESGEYLLLESGQKKIDLFKGSIEEVQNLLSSQVTLTCSGYELQILNKFSHEIIDETNFPYADPDAIGKMLPLTWGRVRKVPFRPIDVGGLSTLSADLTASATSVQISDTTKFSDSGTILIDSEEIPYTNKSEGTLWGLTRPSGAVVHNKGAMVGEVKSEYVYAIGNAINAFKAVYVENIKQDESLYTVYTGQSGDEHGTYTGRAVIAFSEWPQIKREVNLTTAADYDMFREATNVPIGRVKSLDHNGLILDYDDSTTITFQSEPSGNHSNIYVEYEFEFRHFGTVSENWDFYLDGTLIASWQDEEFTQFVTSPLRVAKSSWPVSATKTTTYRGAGMNGTAFMVTSAKVYADSDEDDLHIRGSGITKDSSNVPLGAITSETAVGTGTSLTFPAAPDGNLSDVEISISWELETWGDWILPGNQAFHVSIDDINVACINEDGTITALMPSTFTVLKSSWQTSITKTASILDSFRQGFALTITSATQSCHTDDYSEVVNLSGNSMADSIIGGEVSADLYGYQDDSDGTYTGTPDQLIERPNRILKHLLMEHCSSTSGEIHSPSHGAVEAFFEQQDYKLGVVITERPNVPDVISEIAFESKCIQFWEAGEHHLVHVPSGEIPIDKTLTKQHVDKDSPSIEFTPRIDLLNTFNAKYDLDWANNEFLTSVVDLDEISVGKYGTLEKNVAEYPYVSGQNMATDILRWQKDCCSEVRLIAEFQGGYPLSELERGDVIAFDVDNYPELDTALGKIVPSTKKFRVLGVKNTSTTKTIKALETIS